MIALLALAGIAVAYMLLAIAALLDARIRGSESHTSEAIK